MTGEWTAVAEELDRAADEGRRIEVWLRDDDATDATKALERLTAVAEATAMPVMLAVVPVPASATLADFVARHRSLTPCQHGYTHENHAPPGSRACELGHRPLAILENELGQGRVRLRDLFGERLINTLVPPWNRIDAALVPRLPALGFDCLSTFGAPDPDATRIGRLNADLDIIDWRGGRIGRSLADVAGKLAGLIREPERSGPIGLLTHHLAHDATAWAVLDEVLTRLAAHRAVRFTDGTSLAVSA